MTPTIGRIVILTGPHAESNGTPACPAIITRVWGSGDTPTVNVTAFLDAAEPKPIGSVQHVSALIEGTEPTYANWAWPERAE